MKEIAIDDLRKLMDYEQVINLEKEKTDFKSEGEKIYFGRYDQNIIYDENLAY